MSTPDRAERLKKLSPAKRALLLKALQNEAARKEESATIPRRSSQGPAPLSFAQQRLWFMDQLDPTSPLYNVPLAVSLKGQLNMVALEQSFNEIVRRHEVLRTTFEVVEKLPIQIVNRARAVEMRVVDLRCLAAHQCANMCERLSRTEARRPFDLRKDLLLRVTLLRLADEDYLVLVTMHHIASDGWSLGVLVRETATLYETLSTGRASMLDELPVQYADFTCWQREWMKGDALQSQLAYWKRQLADISLLQLPTDRPRPAVQTFKGARYAVAFEKSLLDSLKAIAEHQEATLFMMLLAAFKALLHRYSSQRDIAVGTPIANRNRVETEAMIGFFANTLVLRTSVDGSMSFRQLLARVREAAIEAYASQDLPFEKLVEELQPERDLSRNPLFQVAFVFQNATLPQLSLPGLDLKTIDVNSGTSKFDMLLDLEESHRGLTGFIEYNTELLDGSTITRFVEQFRTLLNSIAVRPDAGIAEMPLLTEAESHQLLTEWNDKQAPRVDTRIHTVIEAQAALAPDRIALVFEDEQLTYAELNHRANQLARLLSSSSMGPGKLAAVCMDRSIEMVVALLGILKSGGAYLPVDPTYPQDRIAFMLADAQATLLLTQQRHLEKIPSDQPRVLCLDSEWPLISGESKENFDGGAAGDDGAYVIYTSGSTGRPKAAKNSHRGIYNRLAWMQEAYQLDEMDRVLQKTPYTFDVSVWEFFWPLIYGACLVVAKPEGHRDSSYIVQLIASQRVTTLHFVPSLFRVFLEERALDSCKCLKRVICSGEALSSDSITRFYDLLDSELHNLYGPTEAAVDVTCWPCAREADLRTVPIGRPIANTQIYIADDHLNPAPVGVPGELLIGGAGLGQGYLNRPDLTAEKFIPNPFNEACGERLYKSGDLARYLPDGNISYLGRIDHQVKIRGFRIELEEIASALDEHEAVRESAVVVREDEPGDKRLVAYVVANSESESSTGAIAKEEWSAEQVSQWETIFEQTYMQASTHRDPTFNISGWNSSYTGMPIPEQEMREWVDQTVERVLSLKPQRVLEIGCGTGLLLFRIAPHCASYLGTDFSQRALDYIQQSISSLDLDLPQVRLLRKTADDFTGIEPESFDAVILNSVVQYFPSINYLLLVIERAVRAIKPGGFIFIGDVRNLRLLESFHLSVAVNQAPFSQTVEQLRHNAMKQLAKEEELVIAPDFFTAIKKRMPQISDVEIQIKRGQHHNELTRFRYDVILRIGVNLATSAHGPALDWQRDNLTLAAIKDLMCEHGPELLKVSRVPNARLSAESRLLELLASDDGPKTVGQLRQALQQADHASFVDPQDIWSLSDSLAYDISLAWSGRDADYCFDIIIKRRAAGQLGWQGNAAQDESGITGIKPWSAYSNNPLQGKYTTRLLPQLRAKLQRQLPEYMIPAAFVFLDALPLTSNGKVNRRALPPPDQARPDLENAFVAPRTPVEEELVDIFSQVLGIKPIGIYDNFFELGGHSLLATQVISRVRETFYVEDLNLQSLFEAPTVARLVAKIEAAGRTSQGIQAPPIERIARHNQLPLSYAQQRLWFVDQLTPGSANYNIPAALSLTGQFNVTALEQSLSETIRRHEALRTHFEVLDGNPVQVIAASEPISLAVVDLRALHAGDRQSQKQRLLTQEAQRLFDLSRGPLIRAALLRLNDEEHVVLLTMHHIISDGWSIGLLLREVTQLYRAFSCGERSPLAEINVQYVDYSNWQREWLKGEVLETQLTFWKRRLDGAPAMLGLPTDRPRPSVQTWRGAKLFFELPETLTASLKRLSHHEGTTLFMTLLAGFQALLSRMSGQQDLMVGTPIAGRTHLETERLIGFFVNTLVMRTDLSGNPRFSDLLSRVREWVLAVYAHQDLPFEKLVEELQPERSLSHTPLFQVVFALQNAPANVLDLPGLRANVLESDNRTAKFDLVLNMEETADRLTGWFEYYTDLFDRTTLARMQRHFQAMLEAMVSDTSQRLSSVSLMSAAERQQLLVEWNDTKTDYPKDKCVHELFEQQALRSPDAIAVVYEDSQITYAELNAKANQLAGHLLSLDVKPEVKVGVCLDRSLEMIVGVLGILKAGAAYLPLDPNNPVDRLTYILQDAGARVVLTRQRYLAPFPQAAFRVVALDSDWSAVATQARSDLTNKVTADNLAYVMYTSGSTGQPKGVSVAHKSVVRLVRNTNYATFSSDEVFLQFAPLSFDASTLEVWGPLLNGGRLVMHSAVMPSLEDLGKALERHQVTSLWLTAGLFHHMVESQLHALARVRQLLAGGDVLSVRHIQRALENKKEGLVINGYGPTECTTFTCCYAMADATQIESTVPIGTPISNAEVYVVDRDLQPVAIGLHGELCVGGAGLARDYLNRPAQTAEKFIPNPFSDEPGMRLYRTGDLVRYLADGRMEFIGRNDNQVKIRGFRIELGEIETLLCKHPSVREAVAILRPDARGDRRIISYLVCVEPVSSSDLRAFLREQLPDYMLPSAFVIMDELPLTANGKVDRSRLPSPDEAILPRGSEPSMFRTQTEEMLAGIYARILGVERVDVDDNFFELGGHSLLAMQLSSRVRESFEVDLPLRVIFESPYLGALAEFIESATRTGEPLRSAPIRRAARDAQLLDGRLPDGQLPLSFSQQRIWFLSQLKQGKAAYNIPVAVRLTGRLNVSALEQSIQEIIRRHESLRTSFLEVDGLPVQIISSSTEFLISVCDLQDMPEQECEAQVQRLAKEEMLRPFDLSAGPLMRAALLRLRAQEHVVLFTMHHIISDGWSIDVLISEVAALYKSFSNGSRSLLAELPIQYADYAIWQRERVNGELMTGPLSYWKQQLEGLPVELELPTDRPRPAARTFQGSSQTITLPAALVTALKHLSRQENVTLFMTTLAAFQTLLHRYTGEDHIVVGSPVANRNSTETEALIGCLINTLALHTDLAGNPDFATLLSRVRQVTLGAHAHQDVPFEMIVEAIHPNRKLNHNPIFQVWFVLQHAPVQSMELEGLALKPLNIEIATAQFDLTMFMTEAGGELTATLNYSTDLFDRDTVSELLNHYRVILERVAEKPWLPILDIPLEDDEQQSCEADVIDSAVA
jgi:amino acid adenylation domain-containing protein